MALQPTRRQKRPIVLSSDDEEGLDPPSQCLSEKVNSLNSQVKGKGVNGDSIDSQGLPKRSRPTTRSSTLKPRPSTSTQSTLPKSRDQPPGRKSKAQKKERTESLHDYFNAADLNRPQVASGEALISKIEEEDGEEEEEEDAIEDDISELPFLRPPSQRNTTRFVLDRRKQHIVSRPRTPDPTNSKKQQNSSQVFIIPEKASSRKPSQEPVNSPDTRSLTPWAEQYGPVCLEELMVHKKKVADVQNWMENFWQEGNRKKKLLVLKGPAGAGKTATVMTLAKALNMDVVEWRNPKDSQFSSEGYVSMSAQFEDFLGRSGKFGSLEFDNKAFNEKIVSTTEKSIEVLSRRKIILLEEFPNTFTSTSTAAISFRKSLLNYLAANQPPFTSSRHHRQSENHAPIVMIITESLLTAGTSSDDIFSAHRLLGPDILGHSSVSVIEFNSMASTFVIKALDLVIKKEARHSGRRRIPGLSVLKKLGETGDIRSAIAALEFLCLRSNDEDDWGGSVAGRAKKSIKSSSAFTKLERDSLENITRRETSLGIFHAVGKVVYNKREEPSSTHLVSELNPPTQPPDHMAQHIRLQTSLVSPDELIGSTGTDTQTFVATLHENYVSSCEGISFIDSLNGCLDALSDTDILGSNRGVGFGPGGSGGSQRGASDSLRQDEIGFHLAVRGILFALPSPVTRKISLPGVPRRSGGKGDAFKMFYPTSLRLWKKTEEVGSLINRWTKRYEAGVPLREHSSNKPQSWSTGIKRTGGPSNHYSEAKSNNDNYNSLPHPPNPLCQKKNASKVELILETLPYLALIERCCKSPSLQLLDELEQITEFHGLDKLSEEVPDDNDVISPPPPDYEASIMMTAQESSSKKKNMIIKQPEPTPKIREEPEIEIVKLWLSDDDIEDD